jgi:hypothetical protein
MNWAISLDTEFYLTPLKLQFTISWKDITSTHLVTDMSDPIMVSLATVF